MVNFDQYHHQPKTVKTIGWSLVFLLTFLLGHTPAIGQENQKEKSFQAIFDEFKESNDQNFKQFRIKSDSAFATFLRNAWIEYEVFSNPKPQSSKPVDQPRNTEKILTPMEIIPKKNSIDTGDYHLNSPLNNPVKKETDAPTPPVKKADHQTETGFYGLSVQVPSPDEREKMELQEVNEMAITNFYTRINASSSFEATLNRIHDLSVNQQLNGWSLFQLIQTIASHQFLNTNSKVLFTWMALINEGSLTRVCFTNQDVFLLAPFDTKAYLPYIKADEGDLQYYLLLFPGQRYPDAKVWSYDRYQHAMPLTKLSLQIEKLPLLGSSKMTRYLYFKSDTIALQVDKNLIDFYGSYPNCDLKIPFHTPLSKCLQASLDEYLMPKIANRNGLEKVNILLEFVQFAIGYQTDDQQFGQENYLFPEETIYYPFADCEDRVSLMMQLVKRYTGLSTIGLSYPDHISMAVAFNHPPQGAFLSYSGSHYWICDPTYLGSTCGMVMPKFKNIQPEIIN